MCGCGFGGGGGCCHTIERNAAAGEERTGGNGGEVVEELAAGERAAGGWGIERVRGHGDVSRGCAGARANLEKSKEGFVVMSNF